MKILLQVMSSETGLANFLSVLRRQLDQAASPGTEVEVRGTRNGVLADQYEYFAHRDTDEILDNALAIRANGEFDAIAIGNSLDPRMIAMRELLNIPVTSIMEAACFTACTLGESFGTFVPNDKFRHRYRTIIESYGLGSRCTGLTSLGFDYVRDFDTVFTDDDLAKRAVDGFLERARAVVEAGAESLVVCGPFQTVLWQQGIHSVGPAPIIDGFSLLIGWTEMMVKLAARSSLAVSRRGLYRTPPDSLLREAAQLYGIKELARPSAVPMPDVSGLGEYPLTSPVS